MELTIHNAYAKELQQTMVAVEQTADGQPQPPVQEQKHGLFTFGDVSILKFLGGGSKKGTFN